jgi:hypothetical protein
MHLEVSMNRVWPIEAAERLAVIDADISGLVGWTKGRRVFATPGSRAGEWTIRPENKLGPTTVCVPERYLQFDPPDAGFAMSDTGSTAVSDTVRAVVLQCECCAFPRRNPVSAEFPQRNACFTPTGLVERFRKRVKLTCLHWKPRSKPFYCEDHLYSPEPGSGMAFCPKCEMQKGKDHAQ